jgi:acyl CoA:acetate/3-ketoacid CoA transferase beta subunit
MDFEEETRRMRLCSLHPGVSVATVRESTGFELVIPPSVPATQAPSAEELHVLRTRIDAAGLLRR